MSAMPEREPPYVFDLSPEELTDTLSAFGFQKFRARQVLEWVYRKGVADPQQMSNLARADRETLAQHLTFTKGQVLRSQTATDGVQKLLLQWPPGSPPLEVSPPEVSLSEVSSTPASQALPLAPTPDPRRQTECVMIPELDGGTRRTACISSQIGCPVGCKFCASGLGGLDGNLSAGQIVEQVWRLARLPDVGRISNVVFMGMGEPLSNFNAVTRAVRTLMADWGMGISGRRITISTVGLPAQIKRLADLALPVTLAISLHAPNDAVRQRIIPWAEFVRIEQIIDAGRYYFTQTGREVTLEYILLGGVNDQPDHARELARVARTLRSNVNLIRYNEVQPLPFDDP